MAILDAFDQDKPVSLEDHCWNRIGVLGDRTCPELIQVTHCRNCLVYRLAGRNLLDREAPRGYRHEWTERLSGDRRLDEAGEQPHALSPQALVSVVIFRLRQEWFALVAPLFREVASPSVIRTLPHRSNQVLLGLVNIRGEIQLCVSLADLLGLEGSEGPSRAISPVVYSRFVVVEFEGSPWVFAVDELYGVHRLDVNTLQDTPIHVTQARSNFTRGLFTWKNHSVSYLDEELLFHTLNRRVL
ncbi:chemotaxis protein CheW [Geitlerinema sp. PCC 7407]|uniref:chemotaxis protein CheW n=1 Tax=Geitlerinema sp. PCC 7407 TaxID=1173025 RepID=UPI00029F9E81|nr:chemotaxis protein CheW [Geitlerinema sp. PCC 7407]AFY66650.1 CheW protein [Geitlerinema sp. PCC 7407]